MEEQLSNPNHFILYGCNISQSILSHKIIEIVDITFLKLRAEFHFREENEELYEQNVFELFNAKTGQQLQLYRCQFNNVEELKNHFVDIRTTSAPPMRVCLSFTKLKTHTRDLLKQEIKEHLEHAFSKNKLLDDITQLTENSV